MDHTLVQELNQNLNKPNSIYLFLLCIRGNSPDSATIDLVEHIHFYKFIHKRII